MVAQNSFPGSFAQDGKTLIIAMVCKIILFFFSFLGKDTEYLELLGPYEDVQWVSKTEPIYTETTELSATNLAFSEHKPALNGFNQTTNEAANKRDSRRRSRSVDDLLMSTRDRLELALQPTGQDTLTPSDNSGCVEPIYHVLEGPTDSGTSNTSLYQSLIRSGPQVAGSAGADYAKLDIKTHSVSAPYAQGLFLDNSPRKEQRSITHSAPAGSNDRCPLHVNEGDLQLPSLEHHPSTQQSPLLQRPSSPPSVEVQHPSSQSGSLTQCRNSQPSPLAQRITSQNSLLVERPSSKTNPLGLRRCSQPNPLAQNPISQPSPLVQHRTHLEPTYIPVFVKGNKSRTLKHRRNLSDSWFISGSVNSYRRNSSDAARCPVEFNDPIRRVDSKMKPAVSFSWPSSHGDQSDDTHCQVLVGKSGSNSVGEESDPAADYAPLSEVADDSKSDGIYMGLQTLRSEK